MTHVYYVHMQRPGEQVESLEFAYEHSLKSSEQRYGPREQRVSQNVVPLDTGWVADVSYVVIHNVLQRFNAQPTPEEQEEAAKRLVEVHIGGKLAALLPPGHSLPILPAAPVSLRCVSGTALCRVTVFPL